MIYKCFKCPCTKPQGYKRVPTADEEINEDVESLLSVRQGKRRYLKASIDCNEDDSKDGFLSCCKNFK